MQAEGAFVPLHEVSRARLVEAFRLEVVHDLFDEVELGEDVRRELTHAARQRSAFFLLDRYDRDLEGAGT